MNRYNIRFNHRALVILNLLLLSFSSSYATQSHQEVWFKGTFTIPIHDKVKIQNVFEHKRQSGFENNNPFSRNYEFSLKPWVVYQHNKTISFFLSPVAYYASYPLIREASHVGRTPKHEMRMSAAVELKGEILKKLTYCQQEPIRI